ELTFVQEREKAQSQFSASLTAMRVEEAHRFEAAEADWKEKFTQMHAELVGRYENAEAALSQMRRSHATQRESREAEIARLHEELSRLRSALMERGVAASEIPIPPPAAAPAHMPMREDSAPHSSLDMVIDNRPMAAQPAMGIALRTNDEWNSARPR